jgi:flagellar biosynthesis/type III secretory pathway M-ring protein FliF/YscJ
MQNKIIQAFQFLLEVIGIVLLNMFIFLVVFFIILYIFRNDKKDEDENDKKDEDENNKKDENENDKKDENDSEN